MRNTTTSSFLSPPTRSPVSARPTPTVKKRTNTPLTDRRMAATPFSRPTQSVITLFSPMTRNSFTYEAYQEFLVQSYFTSEKSRTIAREQGEGEPDGHKLQFEADINGYLIAKSSEELARIKQIYEEHEDEVERIRYWILQLVSINSSEMIKFVLEGLSLTKLGALHCGGVLDVIAETLISQIGDQLYTFDAGLRQQVFQKIGTPYHEKNAITPLKDQGKERQCRSSAERILIQAVRRVLLDNKLVQLQSSSWHHSPAAWFFVLAFLGLAIGASLHFMPVLGAAIALTVAVKSLALLIINIALPAVALGMVFSLVPAILMCCQKKAPPLSGLETDLTDQVDKPDFGNSVGGIAAKLVFSSAVTSAATSPKALPPKASLPIDAAGLEALTEGSASVDDEADHAARSPSLVVS